MLPAAPFCHRAATMPAYKFTARAVASPDAPQKPLVRKRARSEGAKWVQASRVPLGHDSCFRGGGLGRGWGSTQAGRRSTYARPGVCMLHCAAVLPAVTGGRGGKEKEEELQAISAGPVSADCWERVPTPRVSATWHPIRSQPRGYHLHTRA